MANPPSVRRLLVEDFPSDQQEWIGTLLQILNQFMDETEFALNKGVSLTKNSLVQVKTMTFKGNATIKGTLTSGMNTITNVSSTYSLANGMRISGDGIPVNTVITNISGSTITISNNASITGVGVPLIVGNNFPLTFKNELAGKPIAIMIGDIYEDISNPKTIVDPTTLTWDFSGSQITINHITGLRANVNHSVTFIIYGGD